MLSLCGYFKIGVAGDVTARVSNLEGTLLPEPISIVMSTLIQNGRAYGIERKLHQQFSEKRVRGEWFRLSPADLAEIEQLLNEARKPCGCELSIFGPPLHHCVEAARLRRELPKMVDMPISQEDFEKLPYVQHFLNLV